MARQISRLLDDEKLYFRCQTQGYERIRDFSPDVIAKQLEGLLNDLV
ncbi:hypothetical protein SDC9_176295 [bioreactor metagenome]|uniref:Uncharacterized protein n=1 Tax=bioreactor metagenome TaxID=1076179 RepID=A0A645GRG3_9ZZZZ